MTNKTCEICGAPMPVGEEMFKYHGYSGPCPRPPLPHPATPNPQETVGNLPKGNSYRCAEHGDYFAFGLSKGCPICRKPGETLQTTQSLGLAEAQKSSPGFDPRSILEAHCDHFMNDGHSFVVGELKRGHTAAIQAAKREGAEMCHNELFQGAGSINGVITLDTGETAIRYNNLIKHLEEETPS